MAISAYSDVFNLLIMPHSIYSATMTSPFTGGIAMLQRKWQERRYRKEPFRIREHFWHCADTGQSFSTEAVDALNLRQVHHQYRSRHHIPFPEEIVAIRRQYGLSATKMAEVLDFGVNSYRNYELGEMPSQANAKLIRLAARPERFEEFVAEKWDLFSSSQQQRLQDRIASLKQADGLRPVFSYLWNHHLEPSEFTGFVKPDLAKVTQFVLYFAERARPLKTRLNKLLFFADFLHFKRTGQAISGCNYRAIPYGPVPSHFHELFGMLESQGAVDIQEELFGSGHVGERFVAMRAADLSLFSPTEQACMEQVLWHFEGLRTRDLIEVSHQELAWKENHTQRKLISFQQYAFDLKAL